jgi:hypothetical protein
MLGTGLPERFRPLPACPPAGARLARRDTKLEGKALLSTVPVFRYLRAHRVAKQG